MSQIDEPMRGQVVDQVRKRAWKRIAEWVRRFDFQRSVAAWFPTDLEGKAIGMAAAAGDPVAQKVLDAWWFWRGQAGDWPGAEALLRRALARWRAADSTSHPRILTP
jgi:hypothetical protein